MSHRHTITTKITNKEIAKQALKAANIEFVEAGNRLCLQSGLYKDTVIDLRTGGIMSGDTDRVKVSEDDLGILRQYYTEALYRHECQLQGNEIQSRTVETINNEQCVVLYCRMA